ncbi:hypothetical protein ACFOEK_12280 [Litoribrevibacter euphylliae]|uniref:HTH cro/C1-type domain-containing protein n=1 Tax=Litoribrevibacter euphylliae TaxID=1834034 RepID=A0ABV7HGS0_9GAMM
MKITKRHYCRFNGNLIDIEWLDKKRGRMIQTVSLDDLANALGISTRTLNERLKDDSFSDNELFVIALNCCGRLDQFTNDWAGFRIKDGLLETPFGKRLHPTEIEQYTFYMSIAESYKVELRKIKEENSHLRDLLSNYGAGKVVELPNRKIG